MTRTASGSILSRQRAPVLLGAAILTIAGLHGASARAEGDARDASHDASLARIGFVDIPYLIDRAPQALEAEQRLEAEFAPQWAPGIPVSRFVWVIDAEGDHCRLTLEHYDIPAGGEGYAEGWERLVAGLKSWLETGTPTRIAAPN